MFILTVVGKREFLQRGRKDNTAIECIEDFPEEAFREMEEGTRKPPGLVQVTHG